nr:hypothetical protein [uncultured Allomuricauda sp.]
MKKFSILFLSLFILASCSSDDDDNPRLELIDRDALIALDKANPNNTIGWDHEEEDLSKWNGVTVENNRVTGIVLREKGIKVLPKAIYALTQLDSLILPKNGIERLPTEIGELTSLKKLDLSVNLLSQLPEEFSRLKMNLEHLSMAGNNFEVYPKAISGFESLEYLSVSTNKLVELPAEIGGLTNLKELLIQGNKLLTLPERIGNLSKLEILQLYWNDFESLPNEMGKLESLKEIYISGNQDDLFTQSFEDLINKNQVKVIGVF